ncbi:hypothetical protein [Xanthomonas cassavae]|uniref:hypothetical protein n=1 Tax=Xanthomonas cassavae TaxID=56450 RepID=UPI001E291CD6|nr:hypothetical protein [Xanthomonas cassavae]
MSVIASFHCTRNFQRKLAAPKRRKRPKQLTFFKHIYLHCMTKNNSGVELIAERAFICDSLAIAQRAQAEQLA